MAHLGADVAAFVDGQLTDSAMAAARRHVDDCEACRTAVRQQEALKARMRTVAAPMLPPELLAALAGLPQARIRRESVWSRLWWSTPVRCGVAMLGASLALLMVAYAIGGVREQIGDPVAPPADRYAADFNASIWAQSVRVPSAEHGGSAELTSTELAGLQRSGWPCPAALGADFHRIGASRLDQGQVIALSYANATRKLNLFEQNGALNPDDLDGFAHRSVGQSRVWIREGMTTVVTWDHNGIVYTIVTNADQADLAQVVAQLPTDAPAANPVGRIGSGLDRMAGWISPAS